MYKLHYSFQKEDDLVEHSWKENPDSSPFNKSAFIQNANSTFMTSALLMTQAIQPEYYSSRL